MKTSLNASRLIKNVLKLKIGKGHAALEIFSMAVGIHTMDKKNIRKVCSYLIRRKKKC